MYQFSSQYQEWQIFTPEITAKTLSDAELLMIYLKHPISFQNFYECHHLFDLYEFKTIKDQHKIHNHINDEHQDPFVFLTCAN